MAERYTRDSGIDFAFHRREATRLRDLSMNEVIRRGLRRLRPSPIAWSAVAALIAAAIGWMAVERAPAERPGPETPAAAGFAPASLPIPAGLTNSSYDAN
jgi:hypothetical protein